MGFVKKLLFGGGQKQDSLPAPALPELPELPPEVGPPPTLGSSLVREAGSRAKRRSRAAAASGGRRSTIVTSGQGLTTEASTAKKKLLGQ